MRKFATLLVGAVPVLHEALAELRLLFAGTGLQGLVGRLVGRVVGRGLVGPGGDGRV